MFLLTFGPILNDLIGFGHCGKGRVKVLVESGDVFKNVGASLVDFHAVKDSVYEIESYVAIGGGITFKTAKFTVKGFFSAGGKFDVCGGNFEGNGFVIFGVYGEHLGLVVIDVIIDALIENNMLVGDLRGDLVSVFVINRGGVFKLCGFRIAGTGADTVTAVKNLCAVRKGIYYIISSVFKHVDVAFGKENFVFFRFCFRAGYLGNNKLNVVRDKSAYIIKPGAYGFCGGTAGKTKKHCGAKYGAN